jgi:hypothetical protein
MNTTESLQYFWRKFILESQVPANRFTLNISSPPTNNLNIDASVSREEYAFSRFIQRIRTVYKEILLKPLWVQVCLMHPEIAKSDYLKSCLGITYNEENLFMLAKKRSTVSEGSQTVGTLAGMQDSSGKPVFSVEWLIKEFMGLTDNDLEMNRHYLEKEILNDIKRQKLIKKHQENQPTTQAGEQQTGEGGDFGGGFGGDSGGGIDFGGADTGGGLDFGGSGAGGGMDFGGADTGGGMEAAPADTGGGLGEE